MSNLSVDSTQVSTAYSHGESEVYLVCTKLSVRLLAKMLTLPENVSEEVKSFEQLIVKLKSLAFLVDRGIQSCYFILDPNETLMQ